MIEKSILNQLLNDSTLLTLLGGNKIYPYRVASTAKMPWVVVKLAPGGTRSRITEKFTEGEDVVVVYIDAQNFLSGRNIAEQCLRTLENFRGDMSDSLDVHLTCSSIRDIDGYAGSFRFLFDVSARYKEVTTYPVV